MVQAQYVSAVNTKVVSKNQRVKRPTQITVKAGENLSVIAKRYGMSYQNFMAWTGLTSTNIKAGQKITLPQVQMPAGKGLSYLASKYNMSLNEFCKLNGIKDYRTYVPMKGEAFYAYQKPKTNSARPSTQSAQRKPEAKPTTRTSAATNPATVAAPTGGTGNINTNASKKVNVNGKVMSAGELRNNAISGAKASVQNEFKNYCRKNHIKYDSSLLDTSPIGKYPLPTVGSEGKIVATETVLNPTGKFNGKTVILNSGHGGYNKNNGAYDTGTYTFVKQGNKYVPQFESQKAEEFANISANKLRAQGYRVVMLSGHANTLQPAIAKYKNKYGSENVAFVSLHFKSPGENFGTAILHDAPNDRKYDTDFKNDLVRTYNASDSLRTQGRNGIGVINSSKQMSSVLIEIDRIDSNNVNSASYRANFANKLTGSIDRNFA